MGRRLLLRAMFALALTSLRDEAPTFDEQGFLVRGSICAAGPMAATAIPRPATRWA
jgi:hypothetical protein